MTTLSVCIPTLRRVHDLRRCLVAALGQARAGDEVLVGVSPGDFETAQLLAEFPSVLAVNTRQPGMIANIDALAARASSKFLVFLDDDAVPRDGWLDSFRLLAAGDELLGIAGGRDHIPEYAGRATMRRVGYVSRLGRVHGNHHLGGGEARKVDFCKGTNMMVRRDLFPITRQLRLGGAEPHSEVDLGLRAKRRGLLVVYDPAICVDHYQSPRPDGDRANLKRQAFVSARNETLAVTAWYPGRRWVAHLLYALVFARAPAVGLVRFLIGLARQEPGIAVAYSRSVRGRAVGASIGLRLRLVTSLHARCHGRRR